MKFIARSSALWQNYWHAPVSSTELGLHRIVFYFTTFALFWSWDFSRFGNIHTVFWHPISVHQLLGLPPPSVGLLFWFSCIWRGSLLTATLGIFTRMSVVVAGVLGLYLLSVRHSWGVMRHSDALVTLGLLIYMFADSGSALSLDRLLKKTEPSKETSGWSIRLIQLSWCVMFAHAGMSKIIYGRLDWFSGEVLRNFLIWTRMTYSEWTYSRLQWQANSVLVDCRWLLRVSAVVTCVLELAAPLALLGLRTRAVIVGALAFMQLTIHLTMFITFAQIIPVYCLWIPWTQILTYARSRSISQKGV